MKGFSSPYNVIHSKHVTEKTTMLQELKDKDNHPSTARFESLKQTFIVHPQATKQEIAQAVEEIYAERKVRVIKVNTVKIPSKPRRVRGRPGCTPAGKKAIVTFQPGDTLENI